MHNFYIFLIPYTANQLYVKDKIKKETLYCINR